MGEGIKEITECPFKTDQRPLVPQCLKAGRDRDLCGGNNLRSMDCVGEDACPDMQTYRAAMETRRGVAEILEMGRRF